MCGTAPLRGHDCGGDRHPLGDINASLKAPARVGSRLGITRLDDIRHGGVPRHAAGSDRVGGAGERLAHASGIQPGIHNVSHAGETIGPGKKLPVDGDPVELHIKMLRQPLARAVWHLDREIGRQAVRGWKLSGAAFVLNRRPRCHDCPVLRQEAQVSGDFYQFQAM